MFVRCDSNLVAYCLYLIIGPFVLPRHGPESSLFQKENMVWHNHNLSIRFLRCTWCILYMTSFGCATPYTTLKLFLNRCKNSISIQNNIYQVSYQGRIIIFRQNVYMWYTCYLGCEPYASEDSISCFLIYSWPLIPLKISFMGFITCSVLNPAVKSIVPPSSSYTNHERQGKKRDITRFEKQQQGTWI